MFDIRGPFGLCLFLLLDGGNVNHLLHIDALCSCKLSRFAQR